MRVRGQVCDTESSSARADKDLRWLVENRRLESSLKQMADLLIFRIEIACIFPENAMEDFAQCAIPIWNTPLPANGERPVIRTLTPRRFDAVAAELEVQVVVHDGGAASRWASAAAPRDPVAMSGPGRGYPIDPDAAGLLLVGDETAMPAIGQLLEWMPPTMAVEVHIEVGRRQAELALPVRGATLITWHLRASGAPPGDALVTAVGSSAIADGWRIWAAGEAAAMYRIRHHLFDELGLSRARATVRATTSSFR
jgi:NADPH-dependent ferric siderophore reductase